MNQHADHPASPHRAGRTFRRTGAIIALSTLALLLTTGCGDEESKKFRTAALPAIETGVKSVLDGLVTGFITLNTPS